MQRAVRALFFFYLPTFIISSPNGLARTPPRGWDSWNLFHRNINSSLFRAHADALCSLNLSAAGYEFVSVDGGWWEGSDSGTIPRNSSGFMSEDAAKFPEGMRALVDYVHARGLRWGVGLA